jgi:hypothetical protein
VTWESGAERRLRIVVTTALSGRAKNGHGADFFRLSDGLCSRFFFLQPFRSIGCFAYQSKHPILYCIFTDQNGMEDELNFAPLYLLLWNYMKEAARYEWYKARGTALDLSLWKTKHPSQATGTVKYSSIPRFLP